MYSSAKRAAQSAARPVGKDRQVQHVGQQVQPASVREGAGQQGDQRARPSLPRTAGHIAGTSPQRRTKVKGPIHIQPTNTATLAAVGTPVSNAPTSTVTLSAALNISLPSGQCRRRRVALAESALEEPRCQRLDELLLDDPFSGRASSSGSNPAGELLFGGRCRTETHLALGQPLRRPRSWISTIRWICSSPSAWKICVDRLMSSGRKWADSVHDAFADRLRSGDRRSTGYPGCWS